MATYASLSDSDKAVVQNAVNLIRAGAGEIGQVFNHLRAIAQDTNATALIASVDATDTIPNSSGLAGSDDLTRAEVLALWTVLNDARVAIDSAAFRTQASKAAGINALLG